MNIDPSVDQARTSRSFVIRVDAMPSRAVSLRGGFVCPECHRVLPAVHEAFVAHFRGVQLTCPGCETTLPSLWEQALKVVRDGWPTGTVFQLAGATQTFGRKRLKPDRGQLIDLSRWRIPKTAEILELNCSALGPADGPITMPLRFERQPGIPPHLLMVYGATYGRKPRDKSEVQVAVSWISPGEDEVSIHHLADAARQYTGGRYDGVPIPANIAVEAALTRALRDWSTIYCSNDEILNEFFKDAATYHHQLNVLSLIAADTLRAAHLDQTIRARLNKLRQYRNDVGHKGHSGATKSRPKLTRTSAGELLTAAIFGYHYAQYLHSLATRAVRKKRFLPGDNARVST